MGALDNIWELPFGVMRARRKDGARSGDARQLRPRLFAGPQPGQIPVKEASLRRANSMTDSELYQKGAEMRRRLLGDAAVERSGREVYSDPVMKKFIDLATETVFGALWTRPGLDLKTRALICVVSDAATGREPELGLHIRMALRQGWTEEQLTEALLHLSGYVGVPIIREAMLVASRTFAEFRAESTAERPVTA
jgi:4-carboxymuconolactone decarboxylase